MTLDECYEALGLQPPLEYERDVYDNSIFRQELGRKRIGSTTHMLVEAALDFHSFKERLLVRYPWVILFDESRNEEKRFRKTLADLQGVLGRFPVELIGTTSISFRYPTEEHSMVYIDHHLLDYGERITGPPRLVRRVNQLKDGTFTCFDRNGHLVLRLMDQQGLKKLTNLTTCPIYVDAGLEGQKGSKLIVGGQSYSTSGASAHLGI